MTNGPIVMVEFFPVRLRGIDIDLHALGNLNAGLAAQLTTNEVLYDPASEEHPFIQLAYDEINQASLERILTYSNIVNANRPLGLPYNFTPLVAPAQMETNGNFIRSPNSTAICAPYTQMPSPCSLGTSRLTPCSAH